MQRRGEEKEIFSNRQVGTSVGQPEIHTAKTLEVESRVFEVKTVIET
jgi:hypothetical protein